MTRHHDAKKERVMELAVLILWWAIPVAIVSYLFHLAMTIVLGMRPMNSHLERITGAVEQLAEAERRRTS